MSTDKELAEAEAEAVLWELNKNDATDFTLITSEFQLKKEDFVAPEFERECLLPEDDDEENTE